MTNKDFDDLSIMLRRLHEMFKDASHPNECREAINAVAGFYEAEAISKKKTA